MRGVRPRLKLHLQDALPTELPVLHQPRAIPRKRRASDFIGQGGTRTHDLLANCLAHTGKLNLVAGGRIERRRRGYEPREGTSTLEAPAILKSLFVSPSKSFVRLPLVVATLYYMSMVESVISNFICITVDSNNITIFINLLNCLPQQPCSFTRTFR